MKISPTFIRTSCRPGGFTLVEIVIVMGLMAFFSLLVLLSWRGGGEAAALRAGETILLQAISSTRQQAILRQAQARLLIASEADARGQYPLEILQREHGAAQWTAIGFSRALPRGVQPEFPSSFPSRALLWENHPWQAIDFASTGQPVSSPGPVVLRLAGAASAAENGNASTIHLHATGMATLAR